MCASTRAYGDRREATSPPPPFRKRSRCSRHRSDDCGSRGNANQRCPERELSRRERRRLTFSDGVAENPPAEARKTRSHQEPAEREESGEDNEQPFASYGEEQGSSQIGDPLSNDLPARHGLVIGPPPPFRKRSRFLNDCLAALGPLAARQRRGRGTE